MAIISIIGFVIHRLRIDQRYKNDELDSAIDIIESSKDGLESSISLMEFTEFQIKNEHFLLLYFKMTINIIKKNNLKF
jgi:hypothetical protein